MDEPTNHLDMMSQEILQEALAQYDGTIIVVSHNRYFLDHFVNKVLEIKNGGATLFEGNLAYYLEKTARERLHAAPVEPVPGPEQTSAAGTVKGKKARQEQAKIREEKNSLLKPYLTKIKEAEKEIESLESRKAELELVLADPEMYKDQELFSEKSKEYAAIQRKLARFYQQWEVNQEKVEQIESSFSA